MVTNPLLCWGLEYRQILCVVIGGPMPSWNEVKPGSVGVFPGLDLLPQFARQSMDDTSCYI